MSMCGRGSEHEEGWRRRGRRTGLREAEEREEIRREEHLQAVFGRRKDESKERIRMKGWQAARVSGNKEN